MNKALRLAFILLSASSPSVCMAHGFGQIFALPMPFWMVAWASAAVLLITFVLLALSKPTQHAPTTCTAKSRPNTQHRRWFIRWAQTVSLVVFFLALYAGFAGTQNRNNNLAMTYFWILWLLAGVYAMGLLGGFTGDWFQHVHPYRLLFGGLKTKRLPYPAWLSHWPAVLGLVGMAWLELFGHTRPNDVAWMLSLYGAYVLLGCWLWGSTEFFAKVDWFSVYFDWLHRLGVSVRQHIQSGVRAISATPSLQHAAPSMASVVFVLGLFATTAFDGLKDTQWWLTTVWPWFVDAAAPWIGYSSAALKANPMQASALLGGAFGVFEQATLLLSPLALGAVFCATLHWGLRWGRAPLSLAQGVLLFGPALMPIVLAYSLSHYFTLILTQGVQMVHLLSDPVGRGWNLLGTRNLWRSPILLNAQLVWWIQLGMIMAGHVLSAVLAHHQAFAHCPTRRQANLSQLPVLGLMVALTVLGLWILSQPLQLGR
ncbi:hypothetical protein NQT62_10940 [Limnobacter humi]|uniref:Fenitrothion hydrolase n=1 Tax=Limnobacter humi TaxID=1778671 RepID=A0ABT1WJM8_9BURK|nr:hypothetical protein [Limnobacter humi]MCQ8896947.1 hypothetical protein [Limnobacter humi]